MVNKKNNINVNNIIEKIRTLREFNKNIVPQKNEILPKKDSFKNALLYHNNFTMSQFLKIQLEQLKNKEKEYLNKQIIAIEKYNNFPAKLNSFTYLMKFGKKEKIIIFL